ncbi:hypothetical protein SCHPADRAFT_911400 [Schizopora paradoxa]|uniref:Uncharacterized protein n=1 Tax=Schizopora paradoxa TaxID=27342 RepID=A0A0H2QZK1_9AGAM|nr:hypothetical protein SCHPADRAFT_911400 [Schizopora paradoxa]
MFPIILLRSRHLPEKKVEGINAAIAQPRIAVKPPALHPNKNTRNSRDASGSTALWARTTCLIRFTTRFSNAIRADADGETNLRETLQMRGIDVNASLLRQIHFMTRAQYHHAAGNFFAVDRVPKHVEWGSEKFFNELTLGDKRIHVWIVGTVTVSQLYDHEHQVNPLTASIEIDPISRSTLPKVKELLQRICDAPPISIHSRGGKDVICISKSMVDSSFESLDVRPFTHIFDARAGFNSETKSDRNRVPNTQIAIGDLVLVEAIVTRQCASSLPSLLYDLAFDEIRNTYRASFTLIDVLLLATKCKPRQNSLSSISSWFANGKTR